MSFRALDLLCTQVLLCQLEEINLLGRVNGYAAVTIMAKLMHQSIHSDIFIFFRRKIYLGLYTVPYIVVICCHLTQLAEGRSSTRAAFIR